MTTTNTTYIWNQDGSREKVTRTTHTSQGLFGVSQTTHVTTQHQSRQQVEDEATATLIGAGIVLGGTLLVAGIGALMDAFSSKK